MRWSLLSASLASRRATAMIAFGRFTLDEDTGRLRCGDAERLLRAKSLSVLRELARRPGRLALREELFAACWPKTAVSQTVLRVCVAEIRAALATDPTGSAIVESVGRRGYRLVVGGGPSDPASDPPPGRERELAQLRRAFAHASAGLRQTVFVTGEAGIGKTTVLEHFVEEVRGTSRARVGWGQCVELTGSVEAYLPVLDLLARLGTDEPAATLASVLERWAPGWLAQMPGLVDPARAQAAANRAAPPSRDRLLRELAEAFEALAEDDPLVLVLEDLHWSDFASIDLLAYLAQRTRPARLLLVGSCRPADLATREPPLRDLPRGLVARRRAIEVSLGPLGPRDVDRYLVRRLAGSPLEDGLSRGLHARTRGHPLFLTAIVDDLLDQGILRASDGRWRLTAPLEGIVPDGPRQLAIQQLDRLDAAERRVLDAACVSGTEFAAASVAAASDLDAAEVEEICTRLVGRRELVSPTGVTAWPDGTVSGRYEFRHELFREVAEGALPPARVALLRRAIGERLERAWGDRTADIAAQLASHFAAGGDDERALRYHLAAAAGARARFAQREVATHLRAALGFLRARPDTPDRAQTELACLLDLGAAVVASRGPASEEVLEVYGRAFELAGTLNVPQARFGAQITLCTCVVMRADLHRGRELAADLLATAEQSAIPLFRSVGHLSLGYTLFGLGELAAARRHLAEAHALWRPDFPTVPFDSSLLTRAMLGFTALAGGDPDRGDDWVRNCVAHADTLDSPFNLSYANQLAAQYYATAGRRGAALEHAGRAAAVAEEYGFVTHEAVAAIVSAWARRDVNALRLGIAQYEGTEQYVATSVFRALLIEALLDLGDSAAARTELEAAFAFVERSGERRHLAELCRLEGESVRRQATGGHDSRLAARSCFDRALSVARQQGARLWELRAAISAADLLASSGQPGEARDLLERSVGPYVESADGPDVRRARDLLAGL